MAKEKEVLSSNYNPVIRLSHSIEHSKDDMRLYLQERLMHTIEREMRSGEMGKMNASCFIGCVKLLAQMNGVEPKEDVVEFDLGFNINAMEQDELYDENGNPL